MPRPRPGRPTANERRGELWRQLHDAPTMRDSRRLRQEAAVELEQQFDMAVTRGEKGRLELLIDTGLLRVHHAD